MNSAYEIEKLIDDYKILHIHNTYTRKLRFYSDMSGTDAFSSVPDPKIYFTGCKLQMSPGCTSTNLIDFPSDVMMMSIFLCVQRYFTRLPSTDISQTSKILLLGTLPP